MIVVLKRAGRGFEQACVSSFIEIDVNQELKVKSKQAAASLP
jgi:hypothetical protein